MASSPEDYRFLWITNGGAAEITANSIASLHRSVKPPASDRMTVGVLDDQAADTIALRCPGVPTLRVDRLAEWKALSVDTAEDYRPFGSELFRRVAMARYPVIRHLLLTRRKPLIYADGDIVYLRDPSRYFWELQANHHAHLLTQNDRRADQQSDEWSRQYAGGERPNSSRYCTGLTVWQPRPAHIDIAAAVSRDMREKDILPCDQKTFNDLGDQHLRHVMLLRQDLFPNGSLCFGNRYNKRRKLAPTQFDWRGAYVIHANFMSGVETKTTALKDAGLWYI